MPLRNEELVERTEITAHHTRVCRALGGPAVASKSIRHAGCVLAPWPNGADRRRRRQNAYRGYPEASEDCRLDWPESRSASVRLSTRYPLTRQAQYSGHANEVNHPSNNRSKRLQPCRQPPAVHLCKPRPWGLPCWRHVDEVTVGGITLSVTSASNHF